jgi:hypothetical protein
MFAAVCVPTAAVGHELMSGTPIPFWMLLLTFFGTVAAAWAFTTRERGRVFVTTVTVTVQFALHALFSLGQTTAAPRGAASFAQQWASVLLCGMPATPMSTDRATRIVRAAGLGSRLGTPPPAHAMPGTASMPGMGSMPGTPVPGMTGHPAGTGLAALTHDCSTIGMVVAHLLVAVLCGLWLAHGERTAFRIGRVLATRIFAPVLLILWTPRGSRGPRLRPGRSRSSRRPPSLLLAHTIATRGPPGATAACLV